MREDPKVKKMKISDEKKKGKQEDLFDFIVQTMADFLKEFKIDCKLPLGFTFSFPVAQTSITAGTLKQWTKDFDADGAVGRDVVGMLRDAIARREVSIASLSFCLSVTLFCYSVFSMTHLPMLLCRARMSALM